MSAWLAATAAHRLRVEAGRRERRAGNGLTATVVVEAKVAGFDRTPPATLNFKALRCPWQLTRHDYCNVRAMKLNRSDFASPLVLGALALSSTGCQAVEGIFKAGVWVGVLGVLAVLALIIWGVKALLS